MLTAAEAPAKLFKFAEPQPVMVRVSVALFMAVVSALVGLALVLEKVVTMVPLTGVQQVVL